MRFWNTPGLAPAMLHRLALQYYCVLPPSSKLGTYNVLTTIVYHCNKFMAGVRCEALYIVQQEQVK